MAFTIERGTEENLIFFNAFSAVLGMPQSSLPKARGIKKRDKIFKTLQLILLSYINYVCVVDVIFLFASLLAVFYTPSPNMYTQFLFYTFLFHRSLRSVRRNIN